MVAAGRATVGFDGYDEKLDLLISRRRQCSRGTRPFQPGGRRNRVSLPCRAHTDDGLSLHYRPRGRNLDNTPRANHRRACVVTVSEPGGDERRRTAFYVLDATTKGFRRTELTASIGE